MIRLVPVREEQERLLILSTFVATLNQASPARQFYLSSETELLLNKVLTIFMDGDREMMRAFCGALYIGFARIFPFGMFLEVRSYGHDRLIRFEQEQGQLTRLVIYKHSTNKEIVCLGVETAYLMSDAVTQFHLPTLPFSYRHHFQNYP